ncbi:MAG: hypothetical protein LBU32_02890 [Clostridiales bacterium]|nr:hypothetical protein [Clostridiales bacterium]
MCTKKPTAMIPAAFSRFTAALINQQRKRRVAAYTSISTGYDELRGRRSNTALSIRIFIGNCLFRA